MVKKITLDFSKVEERSGWNTKTMPEGLHAFKIVGVEDKEAQDATPMWVFALVPTASRFASRRFPYYCKLQQNQLWKLRDLFVAAGVAVPKKAVTLDPSKVVGKIVVGEVSDETGQYEGRSTIDNIYGIDVLEDQETADDADDDEVDEEEIDSEDVDEDYDDEADEEDDEDDEEDDSERREELDGEGLPALRKLAKEYDIVTTGLKKADLIEAILEAEAESDEDEDDDEEDIDDEELAEEDDEDYEDDEDEDDEEEEPAPAPRRKAPAKKTAAKPAAKAAPAARRTVKRR